MNLLSPPKSRAQRLLSALVLSLLVFQGTSGSANASEARENRELGTVAVQQVNAVLLLQEVHAILLSVSPTLRSYDRPRLQMINLYVDRVIAALQDWRRGLGHKETMEAFMDLINALDAAESFFQQIENSLTREGLARVVTIKNNLARAYGFDRSTYTLNLYRLLSQMKVLMDEMMKHPIPDELKKEIASLIPEFGFAVVKASQGDRPKAFDAAKTIALKVSSLYEPFNALSSSREVFDTTLMIQFLNERMLDYGQWNSALDE